MNELQLDAGLQSRLQEVVEQADRQLRNTLNDWPVGKPAPIYTVDGRWYRQREMWTDWTPGFYAGQMWILHRLLGDEFWGRTAESYTETLANRRFDRDVHDLGFIFLSSYGRWLDTLGADDPRRARVIDALVTAGTVQSFRWNGEGEHGFIYSFNGPQSLFIDIMMNVRLLFWASRHGAEDKVLTRAIEHCRTTARYLVRRDGDELGAEDGSTIHEAIFNTERGRGEFRSLSTQQGYSPFTCWSRGLAWALYGFSEAYRYTGEAEFLETAELCAEFYLANSPESLVPYWDYGAPNVPDEPLDSSAAAVSGCGFLLLADHSPENAQRYRDAAVRIANSLTQHEFLGAKNDGQQGILLQGVYHRPRNWGVEASVMWGDYFFLELVERLLKPRNSES